MKMFLYLEGGYLILAFIILCVTLFVTTRPFMGQEAKKRGLISVSIILSFFISLHYYITTKRMDEVKTAFNTGKSIICENRIIRKGAQFVTIKKSNGWRLEGENFVSLAYLRPFFSARCIVEE